MLSDDIIDNLPAGVVITDPQGIIQNVNPYMVALLGSEKGDLVGKNILDYFESPGKTNDINSFRTSLTEEVTAPVEVLIVKKDSNDRVLLTNKLIYKDEILVSVLFFIEKFNAVNNYVEARLLEVMPILQKVAIGDFSENIRIPEEKDDPFIEHFFAINLMIGDFADLMGKYKRQTKYLEIEKNKIAKANARDEAILTNIGDGLIVTNREKKIIMINKAAEEMLQIKSSDCLGKPILQLFTLENSRGEVIPQHMHPMSVSLKNGQRVSFSANDDYSLVYGDKKIPVSLTTSPIILDNNVIGIIETFRDATQERQVDKAKTEFVSLASHQLRTPITSINWYTEMLLSHQQNLDADQIEFLREIESSSKRMADLVGDLLNVSRIDLGKLPLTIEEDIHLPTIADGVLHELLPDIVKKKIIIEKKYDDSIPLIKGDTKLLGIIFQNLLSNAIKYTPAEGQIRLAIRAKKQNIFVECADTGYGIPEEASPKIFSKLFRASNVVTKVNQGTGLGLYIVKAIIDQWGGDIRFESQENKGTTFYVTLPMVPKT